MNWIVWASWLFIFVYFLAFFVVGTKLENNSIVDSGWGAGFVLTAWIAFFLAKNVDPVGLLLVGLVTIWGGRLTYHILKRNRRVKEDPRYAKWREEWGDKVVIRAFFQVYMLQGLMMILVSLGFVVAISQPGKQITPGTVIGLLVWLIGFYFEAVGDRQLKSFLANPKNRGQVLTTGLWKFTRHPNYFGEATMWWGIFIIAFSATGQWIFLISPLVITLLLRFVSGVPLLEKTMMEKPTFREYAKKTNAFIPFFPKK